MKKKPMSKSRAVWIPRYDANLIFDPLTVFLHANIALREPTENTLLDEPIKFKLTLKRMSK